MSIFRRKPEFQDAAFEELSQMLWMEDETPTHKRELLNNSALDFSVDSLAHIDNYLDAIRSDELAGEDLLRVVLRCGAYVGESFGATATPSITGSTTIRRRGNRRW